jgi:NADH-quinone oxidoreductase subunit E
MADFPVDPAVSEGRVPDRSPEGIPELHDVDCPPELKELIEGLMAKYPERKSVSIPALWAVQERYGWCTPEGIRQAAAVMRVTPAYLESVASFYDMLHTEPVGAHKVFVCTNISCWMRGSDELLAAFCEASGCDREHAQHGATSPDGEFYVTGFECLGACDVAPMASIDQRYYGPLEPAAAATAVAQLRDGADVLPDKELTRRPLAGDTSPSGKMKGLGAQSPPSPSTSGGGDDG